MFRNGDRSFFVYGFAKSNRGNIRKNELKALRMLAGELLELNDAALSAAMTNETIMGVRGDVIIRDGTLAPAAEFQGVAQVFYMKRSASMAAEPGQ